jgi:hypothetical protein
MPGASQSFADARNPEIMIAMVLRPEVASLTRKDHPAASGDVTRLVGSGKARAGEAVNEIDCPNCSI